VQTLRCRVCRGKFPAERNDAKTCGSVCRQKGYRKRLSVTRKAAKKRLKSVTDNVHFSSRTDEWATPTDTFAALDAEFHFTVDVCANAENAKCPIFFSQADDGLAQDWRGTCFANPPYGRAIGLWVAKAYESALAGATVVMLIPARTDTRYWHAHVAKAAEVRFIPGRLRFGDSKNSAPFPSAVVVFRPPRSH
jgi:phage N-6-adenine-methyltransferase